MHGLTKQRKVTFENLRAQIRGSEKAETIASTHRQTIERLEVVASGRETSEICRQLYFAVTNLNIACRETTYRTHPCRIFSCGLYKTRDDYSVGEEG